MSDEKEEMIIGEARKLQHRSVMRSYMRRKTIDRNWLKANCLMVADEVLGRKDIGLSEQALGFFRQVAERWPRVVPPLIDKLYAGDVHIGSSVTARQAMERIYKGKGEMRTVTKRWAKKGYVIEHEIDPEGGPLEARYVIRDLPRVYNPKDLELKDLE